MIPASRTWPDRPTDYFDPKRNRAEQTVAQEYVENHVPHVVEMRSSIHRRRTRAGKVRGEFPPPPPPKKNRKNIFPSNIM